MSKWIKKDKFKSFVNQRESAPEPTANGGDYVKKWKNPKMGTVDKAKEYRIRLLPDKNSEFYKHYYYHYFVVDETHHFITCPKSDGMDKFCPWCSVSQSLYKGNKEDKKLAKNYSRKEKYVGNILVVDDPRDADVDDEYKVSGKVRIYEFPSTVESTIKNELTDKQEGYGMAIFDPEDGHDMLIKIKAKKPDKNGKSWPDYSDTMFARKASSLGSEKEIDEIMDKTVDLVEYLEKTQLDWNTHKKLLKTEGLWEDVEDEWSRRVDENTPDKTETKDNSVKKTVNEETETIEKSSESDTVNDTADDMDDEEALLEKLKNI